MQILHAVSRLEPVEMSNIMLMDNEVPRREIESLKRSLIKQNKFSRRSKHKLTKWRR